MCCTLLLYTNVDGHVSHFCSRTVLLKLCKHVCSLGHLLRCEITGCVLTRCFNFASCQVTFWSGYNSLCYQNLWKFQLHNAFVKTLYCQSFFLALLWDVRWSPMVASTRMFDSRRVCCLATYILSFEEYLWKCFCPFWKMGVSSYLSYKNCLYILETGFFFSCVKTILPVCGLPFS